jgi:hypothetical protein
MAGLKSRLEKVEGSAASGACPCREPRQVEIVEAAAGDTAEGVGLCGLCGAPAPVCRIEAVKPEGCRP